MAALMLLTWMMSLEYEVPQRAFVAEEWRSAEGDSRVRQEMIEDLLGGPLQLGMPDHEVFELLGEWHRARCSETGSDVGHVLGGSRFTWFPMLEYEWLCLSFDSRSRLARIALHDH